MSSITANLHLTAESEVRATVLDSGTAWLSLDGVSVFVPGSGSTGMSLDDPLEVLSKIEAGCAELRAKLELHHG